MSPAPPGSDPGPQEAAPVPRGGGFGPYAVVADGAKVGDECQIGAHVVIGDRAEIGAGCVLHPGVVIGPDVRLGERVEVFAHAVLGRHPSGAGATARPASARQRLSIGSGCSIGAHATIYFDVEIGEHTLVGDSASIREGARIGERCILSRCVTVNYDVTIGDRVKVMDTTHITGGTVIGDDAFISTMVATTNDNAPTSASSNLAGPVIEPAAVVGAGAVLLPGVVIGSGAVVAAGAVVTADVAPGATVLGVPARVRGA